MTWESNNPIDYSPSGDDIDTFAQKVKADIEQLYTLLDRVRTNDAGVGTSVPDVAGHQWRVDTSTNPETIYIRDVDNSEWVKVGYVAENFGHSAKDIGGIVGKGFNSFTLGKLADRPASAQHTDVFWAYDEGNIYIWNNGGWEIGMTMDFTFLKNMSDTIVQQKEVARSGAEKIPRLNENGVGEFDVTGSAGKIDGYVINISGLKDGQILAFDKARKEVINVDKDVFTEDSASIIGEANKLVKANQYGVIANDTTGNAAKIAYTPIVINADGLANNEALVYEAGSDSFKNKKIPILNTDGMLNVDITGNAAKIAGVSVGTDGSLADGEVLVYREAYKGFRNEPKSSVGSGKALTIKQDDELLDMYSGADAVSVNFTTRNMRLNAKQYIKGDVAYAKELPSNLYLVCTKGGTSAESAPPEFKAGAEDDVLTDGTVAWKVCRLASQDDLKNYVKDIEVSNGNLIVNNGKGERTTLASVSLNMLQRSHTYEVGDIAYTPLLKSYQRLECVVGGTTDSNDINVTSSTTGGYLTDGGVQWIIDDIRDCTAVGSVRGSLYLPKGYVKANGAEVQRADYPRLVALADEFDLWTEDTANYLGRFGVGDGKDTMILPNYQGRYIQYVEAYGVHDEKRNADWQTGWATEQMLPNIKGELYSNVSNNGNLSIKNGAFNYSSTRGTSGTQAQGNISGDLYINFNASQSSSIYIDNADVHPQSIDLIPIIKY